MLALTHSFVRDERILRGMTDATMDEQVTVLRRRIAARGGGPLLSVVPSRHRAAHEVVEEKPSQEQAVLAEIGAALEASAPVSEVKVEAAPKVAVTTTVESLIRRFEVAMANNKAGRNAEKRKMDDHTAWKKAMNWTRKIAKASDLSDADVCRVRVAVMAKEPSGHPVMTVERCAGLLETFAKRNLTAIMFRCGDKVEKATATCWATRDAVSELMKITLGDERLTMDQKGNLLTFLEENAASTFDDAERAKHWFDRALEEVKEFGYVLTRKERQERHEASQRQASARPRQPPEPRQQNRGGRRNPHQGQRDLHA